MNAFEAYAETAAPVVADRRPNRRAKASSALDLNMEEKSRLHRQYKALKRAERIATLQAEPRLLEFMRYLRRIGPDDGDELLAAIEESDWLMTAPQDVRGFALSRIASREAKIRLALGLVPLDDDISGTPSVFFKAQALLRKGGAL